jgi:hypothetical protein
MKRATATDAWASSRTHTSATAEAGAWGQRRRWVGGRPARFARRGEDGDGQTWRGNGQISRAPRPAVADAARNEPGRLGRLSRFSHVAGIGRVTWARSWR